MALPPEIKAFPVVVAASDVRLDVVLAYTISPTAYDVMLVPPLATGRAPETSVVRTTFPYEGAVSVPVERSTVSAAPLASFDRAVEPLAYRISPTA